MSEIDEKRITSKISTIDRSIKQIAAYLSMIESRLPFHDRAKDNRACFWF